MQRDIPLKNFRKPGNPLPVQISRKNEGLAILIWSLNVTGRINMIQSFFFCGSSGCENRFRVSKNFLGGHVFVLVC